MTAPDDAIKQVEAALSDTYTPEGVQLWLHSRNRALDMGVPVDLIRTGDARTVERVVSYARYIGGGAW